MLLCAPSNAAIDELVIRIKNGVEIDGKRILPRLVRLGRDEAVHPNVRDVTMELRRASRFWTALMAAVQVLAAEKVMEADLHRQFCSTHAYLEPLWPSW